MSWTKIRDVTLMMMYVLICIALLVFTKFNQYVFFLNGITLIAQYLPQFRISLVFISKLTKIVDCKLIFSRNSCVLQDLHAQIGHVVLISNLYILILHSQGPACHADTSLHILDSNKIADTSSRGIFTQSFHEYFFFFFF